MAPPITMSSGRKPKRKTAKPNDESAYVQSAADAFPFGAPPSSKKHAPGAEVPAEDASKKDELIRHDKRKARGTLSAHASARKWPKIAADSAKVTAFESSPKKRTVEQMTGPIDDLSVKPTKVTKLSKVAEAHNAPTEKRPASSPVFTDSFSAKRVETDPKNADRPTEKPQADTPVSADPSFGKKVKPVSKKTVQENKEQDLVIWFDPSEESPTSRQQTALLANEPKAKRETPISLQALAEAEEAGLAGLPVPASSFATAAVPKKRSCKAKTKTALADDSASAASAVNASAASAVDTAAVPKKRSCKAKAKKSPATPVAKITVAETSVAKTPAAEVHVADEVLTTDEAPADESPVAESPVTDSTVVKVVPVVDSAVPAQNPGTSPVAPAKAASAPKKRSPKVDAHTDGRISTAKNDTPVHNPPACFTHAIPAALSPWPHSCPAPTPQLNQTLSVSPVNWTSVKGVTDAQKEAYELRAPWNQKPATFAEAARDTQHKPKGGNPSEEGMRKRFKAASLAIFKVSGVYFENSGIGLDAFGVPKKNSELKDLIKQAVLPTITAAAAVPATSSSHSKSTGAPASSDQPASVAADTDSSDDRGLRWAIRRDRRRALQRAPRQDGRQDAHEHRPRALYTGQVVTMQLHSTSGIPAYRSVDAKLVPKYDSLLREEVSKTCHARRVVLTYRPKLAFSPASFDRWFATVFYGTRAAFPTQGFLCNEVAKDTYMVKELARDREGETVDIGTVLETYILSTLLSTNTAASDMLFSELQRRFVAQSSGDELPMNVATFRRMQFYIHRDPKLRDLKFETRYVGVWKGDGSDKTFEWFVDRPSTYQVPPFVESWPDRKDAPNPWYASDIKKPDVQFSSGYQPYVEDVDEFL